ncbi:MAG TPA: DEAD/DEAH box helicase [Azospirillaceae bacterium]|nr:DEAD/DEAH box helicase [Azospirillaceae bacterium]
MTQFAEFALRPEIRDALAALDYQTATPIQAQAIPPALQGRDILGIAQTGTGKTAAFSLPILERLSAVAAESRGPARPVRALVLTPTRELAIQIGDSMTDYGKGLGLRHAVIFGGVGQDPQVRALKQGLDILVATPGRLLDLMDQGFVKLDKLEILVLDEADRMLDMGFIHSIRKVLAKLPPKRQNLFFSATMPPEVAGLAGQILRDPLRVEVTPVATTAERIDQHIIHVPQAEKQQVLTDLLYGDASMERIIVFTRTKHGANRVAQKLVAASVEAAAIHGNKSQSARQAALEGFRAGKVRVLVATDIAARGIDVDGINHVVNFDLPNEPESYVHRIGRTARAGASGIAISLCADGDERTYLRDIEKLIRMKIAVAERPARSAVVVPAATPDRRDERDMQSRGGRNNGRGGRGGERREGGRDGGRDGGRGGERRRDGQSQQPARADGQRQGQPAQAARPQGQGTSARPQGQGASGRPQGQQPARAEGQQPGNRQQPAQGGRPQGAQGQGKPGNRQGGQPQRQGQQARPANKPPIQAGGPSAQGGNRTPARPQQGSGHFADLVAVLNGGRNGSR